MRLRPSWASSPSASRASPPHSGVCSARKSAAAIIAVPASADGTIPSSPSRSTNAEVRRCHSARCQHSASAAWTSAACTRSGCAPTPPTVATQGREVASGLEDRLDLEVDVDLVADDDPATVHGHLDRDAEVLAVDDRRCREPAPGRTERVLGEAVHLEIEVHRTGGAVERELAVDHEL